MTVLTACAMSDLKPYCCPEWRHFSIYQINSMWLCGCLLDPLEGFIWGPSESSCLYSLQKTTLPVPEAPMSLRQGRNVTSFKSLLEHHWQLILCCFSSAYPALKVCIINFPTDSWIFFCKGKDFIPVFIWRYKGNCFFSLGKEVIMPQIRLSLLLCLMNYFSCYVWNCCLLNLHRSYLFCFAVLSPAPSSDNDVKSSVAH